MSATTWGRSTTGISTATVPSPTKTTPTFTARHSGSQRPRLTTCVTCGRARRVLVIGRHQFDLTNGWEGHPPASDHVVVVSHRPRPTGWHPEASYHFATSVEEGIGQAQELAGEGEIGVGAGEVGGQALSLGLIDHVAIDIVPVVFGRGKPYFGTLANGHLMLEDPEVVIQGDGVLHLRYPVHRGPAVPRPEPTCACTSRRWFWRRNMSPLHRGRQAI
jgi:dihydrofolate reductase